MNKKIYRISTGLFSLLLGASGLMYIIKYDVMSKAFSHLGFPVYIVYPLAAAKILGVITILFIKSETLKEWAYAGFFFNLVLAVSAHINAGDGGYPGAAVGLLLLTVSYFSGKRISASEPLNSVAT